MLAGPTPYLLHESWNSCGGRKVDEGTGCPMVSPNCWLLTPVIQVLERLGEIGIDLMSSSSQTIHHMGHGSPIFVRHSAGS